MVKQLQRMTKSLVSRLFRWPPPPDVAWRLCCGLLLGLAPVTTYLVLLDSSAASRSGRVSLGDPVADRAPEEGQREAFQAALSARLRELRGRIRSSGCSVEEIRRLQALWVLLDQFQGGKDVFELAWVLRSLAQLNALSRDAIKAVLEGRGSRADGEMDERRALTVLKWLMLKARNAHTVVLKTRKKSMDAVKELEMQRKLRMLSRGLPQLPSMEQKQLEQRLDRFEKQESTDGESNALQSNLVLSRAAKIRSTDLPSLLMDGMSGFELGWVAANVLISAFSGVLSSLKYHYYSQVVNSLQIDQEQGVIRSIWATLGSNALATVSVYLLDIVSKILTEQCRERGAAEVTRRLQRSLFATLLTLDLPKIQASLSSGAKQQLMRECNQLDANFVRLPLEALSLVLQVSSGYGVLANLCPRLLVLVLFFAPATSYLAGVAQLWAARKETELKYAEEGRLAIDSLLLNSHLTTVRSFNLEPMHICIRNAWLQDQQAMKRAACAARAFSEVAGICPLFGRLMTLYYGGVLVRDGRMKAGDLLSFVTLSDVVTADTGHLRSLVPKLYKAMEPMVRIFSILQERYEIERPPNTPLEHHSLGFDASSQTSEGNQSTSEAPSVLLRLSRVSFAFPNGRRALDDISFEVRKGEIVAIVGSSGSGKSTLLRVLTKLYQPQCGDVWFCGVHINQVDPRWLRRHISVVSQRPSLFPVTIQGNIALGISDVDELSLEEIEKRTMLAAEAANAHLFIEKLPDGYQTTLDTSSIMSSWPGKPKRAQKSRQQFGTDADTPRLPTFRESMSLMNVPKVRLRRSATARQEHQPLSGGQIQRIALARAAVRKPVLYLFDEAFTGLDVEAEQKSREGFLGKTNASVGPGAQVRSGLASDAAVIMVTHKLVNAAIADRILVLEKGRLVEEGTHELLLSRNGRYFDLWQKQMADIVMPNTDANS